MGAEAERKADAIVAIAEARAWMHDPTPEADGRWHVARLLDLLAGDGDAYAALCGGHIRQAEAANRAVTEASDELVGAVREAKGDRDRRRCSLPSSLQPESGDG